MGFSPSFRFGNPYFLEPTVDETIWRTQIKDNVSWVHGAHTIKGGVEWIHTLNDQVFRGFFTGRYIFDSVIELPAVHVSRGVRRIRPDDDRLLRRRVRDGADVLSGGHDAHRRTAAALSPGRRAHRTGDGCDRRVEDLERGVRLLRAGPVAGEARPHAQLRTAMGRADHAGDGRSNDDGVRPLPERSHVSQRWHDPQPD